MSEPKMTPTDLRALADRLEREAESLIARAKQVRQAADTIDGLQALGPPEKESLTSTRVDSTLGIDTMEARIRSDDAKFKTGTQNAGKDRLKTPFGRWLVDQKKAASVWAEEHLDEKGRPRWSPMAVRAWMLPKGATGARGIPEDAAKLIAKETRGAVPATDASWPSGISRPRRRPS